MKESLYAFIYHPVINAPLRFLNKCLRKILPFELPVAGTMEVKMKSGISFLMATNQTSYVTKVLYYRGADAFEYSPIFEKLVTSCDTFIDVGANTGYYSLLAAKVSRAKVFAFEPSAGPLHYLQKNVELNGLQNKIRVLPEALGSENGVLRFYAVKNAKYKSLRYNLGGVGSLQQIKKESEVVNVQVVTLDEFSRNLTDPGLVLMKIDTEGTEHTILQGAGQFISQHKPVIICETLFNKIERHIEVEMKKHDYLFFNFKEGRLHPTETIIRKTDDGVRDCFMVHPSRVNLIQPFIT